MKNYLVAALFSAISATSVQAIENQKTVCSHGGQIRVIEVAYTTEESTPCEVRYRKEEGSQTLWSAENLAGFCEEKAAAFVEKQQGWGWSCEASVNTATTDETEVAATEEVEAPIMTEPEAATVLETTDSAEPVAITE